MNKEAFFTQEYLPLLRRLKANETGEWGVLSAQGMVEHMTDSIGESWGRISTPLQTSADMLPRYREFALSEKEFKPGTKNALMSETPDPLRHASMDAALAEIEQEIANMINYHHQNPGKTFVNPFFGEFNYDEWLYLLHKHAKHHLKQFRLM